MKNDGMKKIREKGILLFLFMNLLLSAGCISTDMGGEINLPPLITYTPHDPVTGKMDHIKALGPLLESWEKVSEKKESSAFFAVRPLASYEKTPEEMQTDFLWPFSALRQTPAGSCFWFFPCFHSSRATGEREHFFFPFLYYGEDAYSRSSFFVFPLYGKMQSGLTGKNVEFILFPLYLHTEKGMTESYSTLWPFLHYEKSPRYRKMRFFPLAAFREDFSLRKHISLFWPLFNYAYSINPQKKGFAFLSLPLGGYESWGKIKNGSIFWPFFSWQKTPEGMNFNGPWPLFRYGRGKEKSGHLFVWPLMGNARAKGTSYAYFLWPTGFYLHNRTPGNRSSRFLCMLPFYLSHTAHSPKGKIEKSYRHIYPFFSRRRSGEEIIQKAPDLTPIRRSRGAERNLLEYFTFFQSHSNKKGISWEILWGMARHMKTKDQSRLAIGPFYMHSMNNREDSLFLDIFFGCVKVFRRGEESCVRLFHLLEIGQVSPSGKGKGRKG